MLSKEQLDFYETNGYILLSNVFEKSEFEECSKSYNDLFDLKAPTTNLEATWAGDWKKSDTNETKNMSVKSIKPIVEVYRFYPSLYNFCCFVN